MFTKSKLYKDKSLLLGDTGFGGDARVASPPKPYRCTPFLDSTLVF